MAGNPLQSAIELSVGYAIDWEATGTWFGGAMTAAAVVVAWSLTGVAAAVRERLARRARAERLISLYVESSYVAQALGSSAAAGKTDRRVPAPSFIEALRGAVGAMASENLPNASSNFDVFIAQRMLALLVRCATEFEVKPWPIEEVRRLSAVADFTFREAIDRLRRALKGAAADYASFDIEIARKFEFTL